MALDGIQEVDIARRLSVVMPVRDGGELLTQAVATVLADLEPSDELIVVNDDSQDGSVEALAKHRQLRIVESKGRGIVAALNTGLSVARGEYLARCDADDEWLPGHAALLLQALDRQPEAPAAFGAAELIDSSGNGCGLVTPPSSETLSRVILRTNPLIHGAVLARLAVVRDVGGYRDIPGAEDYDLWLRLSRVAPVATTSEAVYRYRMSTAGAHRVKRRRQARSSLRILVEHAIATGRFSVYGLARNLASALWPFPRGWYRG